MRRILLALAAVAFVAVGGLAPPAHAGGANLHPVQDRYEPGDVATLVGYVSPSPTGGWLDDGPYFTYAEVGPNRRVLLGRVGMEPSPAVPAMQRVSLTFEVPDDLVAGHYQLVTCTERCAKGLGDLAGGTLNVGLDPVQPIVREWPPTEPEIANLPAGARTTWPAAAFQASRTSPGPVGLPTAPVTTTTAPPPVRSPAHGASPAALALGGAVAAVCVGMVLIALRES